MRLARLFIEKFARGDAAIRPVFGRATQWGRRRSARIEGIKSGAFRWANIAKEILLKILYGRLRSGGIKNFCGHFVK